MKYKLKKLENREICGKCKGLLLPDEEVREWKKSGGINWYEHKLIDKNKCIETRGNIKALKKLKQ